MLVFQTLVKIHRGINTENRVLLDHGNNNSKKDWAYEGFLGFSAILGIPKFAF